MLIDSHIHIGNEKECEEIIKNSKYKNVYRIYSCINPKTINSTKRFLRDVDKYFAIPLFFCETNIEDANRLLLKQIENDSKAIPILLLCKNQNLNDLILLLDYHIIKEHFTLHNPDNIKDRDEVYDYLNDKEGFLLLHTLSKSTYPHVMSLRKEYPNMRIIVAHLGRDSTCDVKYTKEMIDRLHSDEKIYTDISTISKPELIKYVMSKFGKTRVLYGSDFPFETNPEITEKEYMNPAIKANLRDDEYDYLFYKNANNIINSTKVKRDREEEYEM